MLSTPSVPATPALPAVPATTADENVYAAIARWAMRASHGHLTAWTVGGAVDAIGIAAFVRPVWPSAWVPIWPLALPFGCLASIGAWGLATRGGDALARAGGARTPRWHLFRAARAAAVVAGTVLAIATFYVALWLVLGPSWTL